MTLGETLKKLRSQQGIGIKKLAPQVGLEYTYLSKLENDRARPSEEVVQRLARYFSYDAEELLMLAGRIPEDVQQILRDNPREAVAFRRKRFLGGGKQSSPRELH